MRRNSVLEERIVVLDYVTNNLYVTKLINGCMQDGKKATASRAVHKALNKALDETKVTLEQFIATILQNVSPRYGLSSRKYGGSTYQIPYENTEKQKRNKGIKAIILESLHKIRKKVDSHGRVIVRKQFHTFSEALHHSLMEAYKGSSSSKAIKLKNETEQTAYKNLAFAGLARPKTSKTTQKPSVTRTQKTEVKAEVEVKTEVKVEA